MLNLAKFSAENCGPYLWLDNRGCVCPCIL